MFLLFFFLLRNNDCFIICSMIRFCFSFFNLIKFDYFDYLSFSLFDCSGTAYGYAAPLQLYFGPKFLCFSISWFTFLMFSFHNFCVLCSLLFTDCWRLEICFHGIGSIFPFNLYAIVCLWYICHHMSVTIFVWHTSTHWPAAKRDSIEKKQFYAATGYRASDHWLVWYSCGWIGEANTM